MRAPSLVSPLLDWGVDVVATLLAALIAAALYGYVVMRGAGGRA